MTFKSQVNLKKAVLTAPAKLNAPVRFTSPDKSKLTLQQKRSKCKQLEREIFNMRKALDSDSKKVSSKLSSAFQKLFAPFNEKEIPPFMKYSGKSNRNILLYQFLLVLDITK